MGFIERIGIGFVGKFRVDIPIVSFEQWALEKPFDIFVHDHESHQGT